MKVTISYTKKEVKEILAQHAKDFLQANNDATAKTVIKNNVSFDGDILCEVELEPEDPKEVFKNGY